MTTIPSPLNVLVVDDSVVFRKILSTTIDSLPDAKCIAKADSAQAALSVLSQNPVDLVLLDVFMPDVDGIETLKEIKRKYPKVSVVMISGVANREAGNVIEALGLGALDFIPKPTSSDIEESKREILNRLKSILSLIKTFRNTRPPAVKQAPQQTSFSPFTRLNKLNLILIGSSTGGPSALNEVIAKIPQDVGCPILIVQHMPPIFTASLAKHLNDIANLPVLEAKEGMPLTNNQVLIAPGGFHMEIAKSSLTQNTYKIHLTTDAPVNSCRPAVDVLFKSVADNFTGEVLSIILTGMGSDGANGVAALKSKIPTFSIAQNEESCTVYGMPKAVVDAKLADKIIPLQDIAEAISFAALKNKKLSPSPSS